MERMKAARNVAIVLAIAAAVYVVFGTGGGRGTRTFESALWVAFGRYSLFGTLAESSVLKVDPGSGLVVGRIDANLRVDHLLAADTSIWAGSGRTLKRMNPRTMVIEATIPTAKATSLLADGDSIWLASLDDEVVQRTDLRTNRVAATYFVGRFPRDVVANKGTVWVTAGVTRKALVRLAP